MMECESEPAHLFFLFVRVSLRLKLQASENALDCLQVAPGQKRLVALAGNRLFILHMHTLRAQEEPKPITVSASLSLLLLLLPLSLRSFAIGADVTFLKKKLKSIIAVDVDGDVGSVTAVAVVGDVGSVTACFCCCCSCCNTSDVHRASSCCATVTASATLSLHVPPLSDCCTNQCRTRCSSVATRRTPMTGLSLVLTAEFVRYIIVNMCQWQRGVFSLPPIMQCTILFCWRHPQVGFAM